MNSLVTDPNLQDKVVDLYIKGLSLKKIGETLEISKTTVLNVLKLGNISRRDAKVKKDPMTALETKLNCIKLELNIFNFAYKNGEITLEELIRQEERLGRSYMKWINKFEKYNDFNVYRHELPMASIKHTRMWEEDGLQNVIVKRF